MKAKRDSPAEIELLNGLLRRPLTPGFKLESYLSIGRVIAPSVAEETSAAYLANTPSV